MALYIIGDLQGCFDPLQQLLRQIDYDPAADELWFVGDVVNRGPQSLECLRFVRRLEESGRGRMVLGNHDFHLLAQAVGLTRFRSRKDTLDDILNAPDRDSLIDWLRQQPLYLTHEIHNLAMVHAGIPPQWTHQQARQEAGAVAERLRDADWQTFVREHLFGSEPACWHEGLTSWDRLRYAVNAFCRMRYCDPRGCLEFQCKAAPGNQPKGYAPWFVHPARRNKDRTIFFGHWSTLGAYDGYNVHALDTGCLWGGQLTAWRVEDGTRHTLQCPHTLQPGKHS